MKKYKRSYPSKMVAYVPFAQTIGLHLHAMESARIMKRLFCRRKAAVCEACSWLTTMEQPSNIMSPHTCSR